MTATSSKVLSHYIMYKRFSLEKLLYTHVVLFCVRPIYNSHYTLMLFLYIIFYKYLKL